MIYFFSLSVMKGTGWDLPLRPYSQCAFGIIAFMKTFLYEQCDSLIAMENVLALMCPRTQQGFNNKFVFLI